MDDETDSDRNPFLLVPAPHDIPVLISVKTIPDIWYYGKHKKTGVINLKKAIITTIKIAVFFIGWAVLSGVLDIPADNPVVWRFFAELLPFGVMAVFTAVFLLFEKDEVHIPVRENAVKGFLTGSAAGVVWIGLSVVILIAAHQLEFSGKNSVSLLWMWIISAVINVVMQELLIRGYIYQLLKTKYNLPLAVIVITTLFTFLHGGAFEAGIIPVLNVVTMCLFTTALYESEKTLLAPIAAHALWNVIGAIIIGGVSLADDYPSLYNMIPAGKEILSGGAYKIEGSIVVLIINILLMILFYMKYKRRVR